MKDIRILYETFGAEEYYRAFGEKYENPHEIQVKNLIIRNLHRWDCSGGVLDFCAGGGEVTRALQQSGVERITGCDPFTYALYEKPYLDDARSTAFRADVAEYEHRKLGSNRRKPQPRFCAKIDDWYV